MTTKTITTPPPFADALRAHGYDPDAVLQRAAALARRRIRHARETPFLCLTVCPESIQLQLRACVVARLRADALDEPARLLERMHPRAGELACWLESETDVGVFRLIVESA